MHGTPCRGIVSGRVSAALTLLLPGLAFFVPFQAGWRLPVAVPSGLGHAERIVCSIDIFGPFTLAGTVLARAGFHTLWHLFLHDNALRVMETRVRNRYP